MSETVTVLDHEQALKADLTRLGRLLEIGDVEGARSFVKELEGRWPESERVRHYVRVLAPPR
jgi:hypothetical protein